MAWVCQQIRILLFQESDSEFAKRHNNINTFKQMGKENCGSYEDPFYDSLISLKTQIFVTRCGSNFPPCTFKI